MWTHSDNIIDDVNIYEALFQYKLLNTLIIVEFKIE